jgi:hypothetical protein
MQRTLIRHVPAVGLVALALGACGADRHEPSSQTAAGQRVSAPAEPRLQPASRSLTPSEQQAMQPSERAAPPTARFEMDMQRDCPMTLEATKVTALPREDGMALSFETRSGSVDELRRRVHWLAAEYESRSDYLLGVIGMATASDVGRPVVRVDIEDVANGAKIVFAGHRQGDIDALRIELRQQVDTMTRLRSCSFLTENIGPNASRP